MKKKNTKLVKPSKIIFHQTKTLEYSNIVDIKSAVIEHLKTSHKLSRTMKQIGKVFQVSAAEKDSDSSLYTQTKKTFNKKS